jgi:fumarate hydratase class II
VKDKLRVEKDSLGEVHVAASHYWGAQTERARHNFKISHHRIPVEIIHALAYVKKAAAIVNSELKLLPAEKKELISAVCDEITAGTLDEQFPLVIWQSGSGTQTNINMNEVISNRAIEKAGGLLGSKDPIHPNDDVNMSQSSNDVFPTAMSIATVRLVREKLLPKLTLFYDELIKKSEEWEKIIKIGRTHLMDATPITLGQEFSGYASQMKHALISIEFAIEHISELAIGGTAVGTGLNSKESFAKRMAETLSRLTGFHFVSAPNKFEALAAQDGMVAMSGSLRQLAVSLIKIANDIRWLGSGPRCGIGEILLPINEPGSSIMPGKANPTQCEALMMVCFQVMGHDSTVALAGSMGNFELNVFKPVIAHNLLESIHLLSDAIDSFLEKCLKGLRPNLKKIHEHLHQSLMLATALNNKIGYEKTSEIVKKACAEEIPLKKAAVKLGFLTEKQFDEIVDPRKMIHPNI